MTLQENLLGTCAFYGRFSSDDQNEKSAEDQLTDCRAYVEKRGGTIPEALVYKDEGISGANVFKRSGYKRLIEDIETGKFNTLIVESLCRLARNEGDLHKIYEQLQFYGIKLISLNDGDNVSHIDIAIRGYTAA